MNEEKSKTLKRPPKLIIELDERLRAQFKSKVYANQTTIKNILTGFIRRYVENGR